MFNFALPNKQHKAANVAKQKHNRGVAQLASVLAWGARGRLFESGHPDRVKLNNYNELQALPIDFGEAFFSLG